MVEYCSHNSEPPELEARLRIMQLLLSAHPDGLVVSGIQEELEIPNSTLSHHFEKLKAEDPLRVRRRSKEVVREK